VPGYSDLDDYGSWREEPDYGAVWYPRSVEVGWAPYSYGYWNWVGPWGWTWVDYAPWGFALITMDAGRLSAARGAGAWSGLCASVYGPAFVGFVGGGHFGAGSDLAEGSAAESVGSARIREPFHPWYHTSNLYVRNVNINNTRITNINVLNSNHNNFNYAYARNVRAVNGARAMRL